MKKTISAVLAILLVCSCMISMTSTALAAANEPSYSVSFDKTEAHRGDTIKMSINIANNPGLITLRLRIVYDESAVTLVSVENKALLNGWTTPAPTIKSPYILRWADSLAYENNNANGTVAVVTFKINDDAAFANTPITIEHIQSLQQDGTNLTFADATASIFVTCTHGSTTEQIVKQPTHTEPGSKKIVCSSCGVTFKTEIIEALGHTFGEWEETKAPTCTEPGEEKRVCDCGETETRAIPATGHTPGEWTQVTAPTCTEEGLEEQRCTVCGEQLATRPVEATGHTPGEWIIVKEPSCTEDGEREALCEDCGTKFTESIPATGHTPGEWTQVTAPTCTEEGLEEQRCTVCGEQLATRPVEATGHTSGEWTITMPATCTEDGVRTTICTVCGEEYTEIIPATGHQYGTWTVIKEATETAEGLRERICSVCGEKESEIIPVLSPETTNNNTNTAETDKVPTNSIANRDTSETSPVTGFEMNMIIVAEIVLVAAVAVFVTLVVKRKKKSTDR